jgi:hypothetical protein
MVAEFDVSRFRTTVGRKNWKEMLNEMMTIELLPALGGRIAKIVNLKMKLLVST